MGKQPKERGDPERYDRTARQVVQQLNRWASEICEAGVPADQQQSLLERAVATSGGPLEEKTLRAVLREFASGVRSLGAPTRVAYLGPPFTFSHLAAIHHFGQSAEMVASGSIAAVFDELHRENVSFGVVPMENSTDGRVTDTLDCFSHCRVAICGEVPLRIRHCLLGRGKRQEIRDVCSKPQALSQCRNWLASQLPEAATRAVASTAEAAQMAASDRAVAAIASEQAGVAYGLDVLARDIADQPDNVTRFAVIGRSPAEPTGQDKTALMFEIPHQPGALADAMAIFKRHRLNMTWIESFPIPGSGGRYLFFVEYAGHQTEEASRGAIEALRKKAVLLEVLGSYAQAEPIG